MKYPLNSASPNGTFHLSPHENICTIALITIHYLYITARFGVVLSAMHFVQCNIAFLMNDNNNYFQTSNHYGSPTRVSWLKFVPNMVDPISIRKTPLNHNVYHFSQKIA